MHKPHDELINSKSSRQTHGISLRLSTHGGGKNSLTAKQTTVSTLRMNIYDVYKYVHFSICVSNVPRRVRSSSHNHTGKKCLALHSTKTSSVVPITKQLQQPSRDERSSQLQCQMDIFTTSVNCQSIHIDPSINYFPQNKRTA